MKNSFWKKELKNEEFIVNLKVEIEEENITLVQSEENKLDSGIKPIQLDNKPGLGLSNTGGVNTELIIMGALIFIIGGIVIYKHRQKYIL